MKTMRSIPIVAILALFAIVALAPATAFASQASRQKNKNLWRNLAIGSGVVAGYGLLHHNGTATTLGIAGAGYSLYRYEQDRKSQSAAKRARASYYYRHYLRYHRRYTPSSSIRNGRKYYTYGGHRYYEDMHTGSRFRIN
jgi:hypothetical protein